MEQLIKITESNGQKAVSAFELYKALGYGDTGNFARWKKKNITESKFAIINVDWSELVNYEEQTINKTVKANDCIVSVDFAKRVCMLARTEIGEQIRSYFIEVEKNSQNNYAINLLRKHFEIKKRLETNKATRKAISKLVYKDAIELQENENKMLHLIDGNDSKHIATLQSSQQKTLFD